MVSEPCLEMVGSRIESRINEVGEKLEEKIGEMQEKMVELQSSLQLGMTEMEEMMELEVEEIRGDLTAMFKKLEGLFREKEGTTSLDQTSMDKGK